MSQRRRSRYTVFFTHVPEGQPCLTKETAQYLVILAYSADDARYYYAKRGYHVSRVGKGDVRVQLRASEAKRTGGGWRVSTDALNAAKQQLGISLPIKLRTNARYGNTNGNYQFRDSHHEIMLKSYHTADQANSTLWHELQHCAQAEEAERNGGWRKYQRTQRLWSYQTRPMEIEARRCSDRNQHTKIVVPIA